MIPKYHTIDTTINSPQDLSRLEDYSSIQILKKKKKKRKARSSLDHSRSIDYTKSSKITKLLTSNIVAEKRIEMQNERLMKRLMQIQTSKNCINPLFQNKAQSNTKARKVSRIMKDKYIQQQNDSFVERMVNRLNLYDGTIIKHSKEKKNNKFVVQPRKYQRFSFVLPTISRMKKPEQVQTQIQTNKLFL